MWILSLGQDDALEEGMATHSSILAWEIPWTEEPGGLQPTGSQRVDHDRSDSTHTAHSCSNNDFVHEISNIIILRVYFEGKSKGEFDEWMGRIC